MLYFLGGLALLGILLFAGRRFVAANPARLAMNGRLAFGGILLAVAAILGLTGRMGLAVPAAIFGVALLRAGWGQAAAAGPRKAGQRSRVRTALIEMELDHDSGRMTGIVLAGTFSGRELDSLLPPELKGLWQEAATDRDSRALAEAYLDRRLPGWRVDFEADAADGQGGATGAGAMTDQEAYQILGLAPGAGEAEIRAAHRRLMKRLHPDHGGTTFLAAKLNEAKDKLLRRH
ncbi:DnaJ domain-containing protein [Microvirga tunisiensis]|uniref:DnaJ domain-containing protein n=1 Tax=Pannonibacter tanglangensis TaxID=2750084 RepID=A0A7X5F087_9HYPH|nr:DnaJ domain-containing protein [Pannonibacter sp. XCT-53]NBN77388.1 DnaJ domain-containing protein [Pannonibacter sp. XCT-53]